MPALTEPRGILMFRRFTTVVAVLFWTVLSSAPLTNGNELNVLFLGDNGHHQPRLRYEMLKPAMQAAGIKLTYTDDLNDLSTDNLSKYDSVMLYANIDNISKPHEKSLLNFVSEGGGFVPVHCATFCFRNSPELIALMGAQFQRHGTGTFRTEIEEDTHPLMNGFGGFESWDETYVHHLHNETNRTVLSYRVDREGREPWTWIKPHGQGRVF